MNVISLIYLRKNPKMPFASRQYTAWRAVCASVMCDTLAARHLTASFFSAAPSLAPLAEPWLGWQSAVCLQAAFSCLSPPEQKLKRYKITPKSQVWEPESAKSEVDEAEAKAAAVDW